MDTISDRIKHLRKSENLTQKDFAKRLLISQSYLSGLESGNETPTSKLLKLICLEFGVKESWLLNGTDNMYDDVYENDKSVLADTSNSALLKILTLLSTSSNVEYGFIANCIDLFATILKQSTNFNEDNKLHYLSLLQNLIMDLDRFIYVSTTNKLQSMEQHKIAIQSDIDSLLAYMEKIKENL
jgi:transcriptional regulator with XRE-family HTH domain